MSKNNKQSETLLKLKTDDLDTITRFTKMGKDCDERSELHLICECLVFLEQNKWLKERLQIEECYQQLKNQEAIKQIEIIRKRSKEMYDNYDKSIPENWIHSKRDISITLHQMYSILNLAEIEVISGTDSQLYHMLKCIIIYQQSDYDDNVIKKEESYKKIKKRNTMQLNIILETNKKTKNTIDRNRNRKKDKKDNSNVEQITDETTGKIIATIKKNDNEFSYNFSENGELVITMTRQQYNKIKDNPKKLIDHMIENEDIFKETKMEFEDIQENAYLPF